MMMVNVPYNQTNTKGLKFSFFRMSKILKICFDWYKIKEGTYRPGELEGELDGDVELDRQVGEVHRVVAVGQHWGEDLGEVTVHVVRDGGLVVGQTDSEEGPAPGRAPVSSPDARATVPVGIDTVLILKSF